MASLLERYKSECATDYVIISDGQIIGNNPVIESTLRGGFNVRITLQTAKQDMHSGTFGGAIPNAASVMADFLGGLIDAGNNIKYSQFYKDVDEVDVATMKSTAVLSSLTVNKTESLGVRHLTLRSGENFYYRTCLRPTIQITSLNSGYVGSGFLNSVPSTAEVRLNIRTVSSQKSAEVYRSLVEFIRKIMPSFVDYEIEVSGMHEPIKLDINSPMHVLVGEYLEKSYGEEALISFVGGAIPFVGEVKRILGKDSVLVPFANSDCNMHGPEENFSIDLVYKALTFSDMLLAKR